MVRTCRGEAKAETAVSACFKLLAVCRQEISNYSVKKQKEDLTDGESKPRGQARGPRAIARLRVVWLLPLLILCPIPSPISLTGSSDRADCLEFCLRTFALVIFPWNTLSPYLLMTGSLSISSLLKRLLRKATLTDEACASLLLILASWFAL